MVDSPIRYLKEDCTGLASLVEYGKKGDKVQIVSVSGNMALVEGSELFHVRVDKLSEVPVEAEISREEEEVEKVTRERKKKEVPIVKEQNSLF